MDLIYCFVDSTLAVGAEVYSLELTVKNKGDDAYNAKLYVTIPKGIKVGRIFRLLSDAEDVSFVIFVILFLMINQLFCF